MLGAVEDEQHSGWPLTWGSQTEGLEHLERAGGLGLVDVPAVEDLDPLLGGAVRQGRAQRETHHLLRGSLRVAPGLGAVRDSAAPPLGRSDEALAGPPGAFLAPRLGPAAGDLGPGLRRVASGASMRELGGDDLVKDGEVRDDLEQVGGNLDGSRGAARRGGDVEVHALSSTGASVVRAGRETGPPLTALRTKTRPPAGPGTEPRISRRPRSASPSTTSRLRVVTLRLPCWPAIPTPLNLS